MVDLGEALSNLQEQGPEDLSSIFETLADWEAQLQSLPVHQRKIIEELSDELGGPEL